MLSPRFLKLLPVIVSALMAVAMFVQMQAWAVTDDASAFHQSIREAVKRVPIRFSDWEGAEIEVPKPAADLLRPNALFARQYENLKTQRAAKFVFVHCTDSRDMSGHYPPNCYPARGWTREGEGREVSVTVGRQSIPAVAYEFKRVEMGTTRECTVYNFFILPSGFETRMSSVQTAGGDRRLRPYGAAQVQVILDSGTPEVTQLDIVAQLLEPLAPIIDTLQVRKKGNSP